MTTRHDVIVIGGGIMGSTSALSLARRGARVLVLERSVPGAEASSAAAGIIGAQIEPHGAGREADLALASRDLYPRFAADLNALTGLDVGYLRCGVMKVGRDADREALLAPVAWQRRAGLLVDELHGEALHERLPPLAPHITEGVFFPDDAQVDPQKLLRAVQIAATQAGVSYQVGAQVKRIVIEGDRAAGVLLEDTTVLSADHVVLAAGAWSSLVESVPLPTGAVRPVRGQIVELSLRAPLFSPIVFGPGAYLVPRADGRVLVGSTMEMVGFRRDVTARGIRDLLAAATAMFPDLEDASFSRAWSSFRPYAPDGGPFIGPSELRGLVLATGHHRNGILLAPLTGELVAAAIEGRRYDIPHRPAS